MRKYDVVKVIKADRYFPKDYGHIAIIVEADDGLYAIDYLDGHDGKLAWFKASELQVVKSLAQILKSLTEG
jgi:hypothetical protein